MESLGVSTTTSELRFHVYLFESEEIWPHPSIVRLVPLDRSLPRTELSEIMLEVESSARDALEEVYCYINEKFRSNERGP